MEQFLLFLLPVIPVIVSLIVFALIITSFICIIKKKNIKVKNVELHVGKHQWFKVEYK